MGWGFDIFQKFAVKFPAHEQIIVVLTATKFPHPGLHIAVKYPKTEPKKRAIKISPNKTLQSYLYYVAASPVHVQLQLQLYILTIIHVTLRRIQKPSGESPHFVSLNIPFLVKGTKKVNFISLQ